MGKGKRNKIKSKKSNKLNKNTTPKMSLYLILYIF